MRATQPATGLGSEVLQVLRGARTLEGEGERAAGAAVVDHAVERDDRDFAVGEQLLDPRRVLLVA
jgi:hypothetical protein